MNNNLFFSTAAICAACATSSAFATSVIVDYRYDTSNFFASGSSARTAMDAAATRWSNVLASGNLGAAAINDTNDGRIGFTHPSTGASFQVSGAANSGSDNLVNAGAAAADEYRSITFSTDQWILYPGARSLGSDGVGGTGTGTNFTTVFSDPNSHINRGFNGSPVSGNLPTWGGSISFDDAPGSFSYNGDFYTVALHEIGHALGLATTWNNFDQFVNGSDQYSGPNAISAYNTDNGTSLTSLTVDDGNVNNHWADGAFDSVIFDLGGPDYSNTVGAGNPQDLLMEPIANFSGGVTRFELTNVDVASAEDVGWTVIPEPTAALLVLGGLMMGSIRRRR